jgi:hypothetical protein
VIRKSGESRSTAHNAKYLIAMQPKVVLSNNSPRDCPRIHELEVSGRSRGKGKYAEMCNFGSGHPRVEQLCWLYT